MSDSGAAQLQLCGNPGLGLACSRTDMILYACLKSNVLRILAPPASLLGPHACAILLQRACSRTCSKLQ